MSKTNEWLFPLWRMPKIKGDGRMKIGDKITHQISIRSWSSPRDHWIKLFDDIRSGKVDIVSAVTIDVDTLKIVTIVKKLEEE